ncbi:hypothetical protein [Pseudomonas sp. OHS18]|uniref:hypothetical protein n=1 Tax=Pseudomonas sp. OHS18 TaxID=3399679 RepID=UPI003A8BAC2D
MSLSLINRTRQELLDFVGLDDTIVSASGTQLVTAGGQTLVDFVGQFGAVPFGYAPSAWSRRLLLSSPRRSQLSYSRCSTPWSKHWRDG